MSAKGRPKLELSQIIKDDIKDMEIKANYKAIQIKIHSTSDNTPKHKSFWIILNEATLKSNYLNSKEIRPRVKISIPTYKTSFTFEFSNCENLIIFKSQISPFVVQRNPTFQ